ncbi:lipoprotein antigen [Mycolicibacterium rutilum]|uniref:Lipoprotein antigen n=1 Tax=Mycolicibacterium rutilum TaxID=370526 RepID=A0A1H6INK6_MYCRU|nr:lipoprotein LpqH [Mycolicibacterium rutilum]SEH48140.1 lipoprotein antigen [Mycolicibacterium rutilum]
MRYQPVTTAATALLVAGCGLTGPAPNETPAQSGHITIADRSRTTQSVECTQHDWAMTIDADANPGRAQVYLELGGAAPVVRTVTIENVDGLDGVSGGDTGKATASTDGNVYKVSGTAVVADRGKPGQTRPMPFEITAPC